MTQNPFDTPLHGLPRLRPRSSVISYRCFIYDCHGCNGMDVFERACACSCHFTHPTDGQGGNHRERSLMADAEQLAQDAHAEARDAFAQAKRIVGVE